MVCAGPRRAWWVSAVAMCAIACGSSPCTIDGRVASGGSNCGTFDLANTISVAAMQAAQKCVVDAVMAGAAFKIEWSSADERGPTTEAYGSSGTETPFYHYLSQGDSVGPTQPNVRRWTCSTISATPGCTVTGSDFCLSCSAEGDETQLCGS
jgi:hypothetical protein